MSYDINFFDSWKKNFKHQIFCHCYKKMYYYTCQTCKFLRIIGRFAKFQLYLYFLIQIFFLSRCSLQYQGSALKHVQTRALLILNDNYPNRSRVQNIHKQFLCATPNQYIIIVSFTKINCIIILVDDSLHLIIKKS